MLVRLRQFFRLMRPMQSLECSSLFRFAFNSNPDFDIGGAETERASVRRKHQRARLPHRGVQRWPRQVAGPDRPRPWWIRGAHAVLREDTRRSGRAIEPLACPPARRQTKLTSGKRPIVALQPERRSALY